MTDRDRESLDGLPRIAPTRDDIESRRTTARKGDAGPPRRGASGGGSSVMTNLVMIVLIAGLTACGWFLLTQQQALDEARTARSDAERRLLRIEERLSMTDQALNATESQTQTQLEFWESEIRKLWDVANKRNKDWIEKNQAAIAKLTQTVDAQAKAVDQVRAQAADLRRAVGTQEEILTQLTSVGQRTADLTAQQRTLMDRVNALQQTTNALDSGLARRVASNEEAVASMDAFRREMVGRITRLQQQLDALSGGSSAPRTLTPTPSP
jgi:chromosome segregation ATPase